MVIRLRAGMAFGNWLPAHLPFVGRADLLLDGGPHHACGLFVTILGSTLDGRVYRFTSWMCVLGIMSGCFEFMNLVGSLDSHAGARRHFPDRTKPFSRSGSHLVRVVVTDGHLLA